MKKIRFIHILLSTVIMASVPSCEKITGSDNDREAAEDPADYTWDASEIVSVSLNNNSITVSPSVAKVSESTLEITSPGTYQFSGSLTDGQIIVNSEDDGVVRLILKGASVSCSDNAAIYIKDSQKTIIFLETGTQNYLTDGNTYNISGNEPNAALFSNSYLAISGEGSLTVTGNYNDGISTDDGLLVKSGTITVTSADDGIRGKDYVVIRDGNITLNAKGDGILSDNEEDTSKGYIAVDDGTFNINSTGDGISAMTDINISDGVFTIKTIGGNSKGTDGPPVPPGGGGGSTGGYTGLVSAKGIKGLNSLKIKTGNFIINSADDAIHSNASVTIENGTLSISSGDDAIHADKELSIKGGFVNIIKSYEGIESAQINISGGNINLAASDDGINSTMGNRTEANDGSSLNITGGIIYVSCSGGDGLDCNGNLTMKSGIVVVQGPPSQPEVGFDVNGTFRLDGGFFIASGPNSGNMIEIPANASSQYSVIVTISATLPSSTLFNIRDDDGNDLVTFKPERKIYYIVFSSEKLKSGSKYSVYTGGSSTGTCVNGIYTEGTYSGGTLRKTFTLSNKITGVTI